MAIYTKAQRERLQENPYTYKVTENQLSFTAAFKREFWNRYQAGFTPRTILKELGYDVDMFPQKRIDSMVQNIRKQALAGQFHDGAAPRSRRNGAGVQTKAKTTLEPTAENMGRIWNELQYLRQEVEFIKRIRPAADAERTDS